MRSLLTLLVGLFISINVFSQEIEYPRYQVDSLGQSVVVMTIEQAQTLDNNSDLLELPWVTSISPITAKLLDNGFTHQATFTLGVDYLVK